MNCPCYSGKPYSDCCEPYHKGALPENALLLMRSRYAAYALGLADYIMKTTAHTSPTDQWRQSIADFSSSTNFWGLEILSYTEAGDRAVVKFAALLKQGDKDTSFTENSQFVKEGGRWLYIHPGGFCKTIKNDLRSPGDGKRDDLDEAPSRS
jgi:SEC-C motif domain protein